MSRYFHVRLSRKDSTTAPASAATKGNEFLSDPFEELLNFDKPLDIKENPKVFSESSIVSDLSANNTVQNRIGFPNKMIPKKQQLPITWESQTKALSEKQRQDKEKFLAEVKDVIELQKGLWTMKTE